MWFVWLFSVARSCATRDANNKDYVCEPTIPAGINRPPPSETISRVTRVPDHQTGYFLDDLRACGINTDQWTIAAQDEGEWRRTAGQGVEGFMAKWIAAEKARAGLRHVVLQ